MRRFFLAVMAIIIAFCVNAQDNLKAREILEQVSNKTRSFNNISAQFVFTMKNEELDINEENEGTIKIEGKKYVIDLPAIGARVISDGSTVWNYMKDVNQVTISDQKDQNDELMDFSSIFSIYEKDFKSTFTGEKNERNKILYQIEMYPGKKEYDISKIILYIDKASMMIDSADFYGTDGNLYSIEVKNMETNLNLPDSFFVFNASEYNDIEVIDFR
jgi:outer membrane lipoprotein-sorting protein